MTLDSGNAIGEIGSKIWPQTYPGSGAAKSRRLQSCAILKQGSRKGANETGTSVMLQVTKEHANGKSQAIDAQGKPLLADARDIHRREQSQWNEVCIDPLDSSHKPQEASDHC
jgi:hypothetical protein